MVGNPFIQLNRRIWTKATRGWSAPEVRHFFRQQCWLDGEVDDGNSIMMRKQPAWCWFVTFFTPGVSTFFLPDNIIDISVIIQCWRLMYILERTILIFNFECFPFWNNFSIRSVSYFSDQATRVNLDAAENLFEQAAPCVSNLNVCHLLWAAVKVGLKWRNSKNIHNRPTNLLARVGARCTCVSKDKMLILGSVWLHCVSKNVTPRRMVKKNFQIF